MNVNAETIPSFSSYLRPSPHLMTYWAQMLPRQQNIKRVGIAWQGNPDHQADVFRSVPLQQFEVLSDLPNVELYSLQSGHGVEQMAQWRGAQPLKKFGDNIDKSSGAFMDTAAIMHQMDVVITSDTSIAHLAGALGVPTWIALNYIPDWRWLLGRSDSPWYPSVRLFRQPQPGDWPATFQEIKQELLKLAPP